MARNKKRKTECNACYKCHGNHAKKCKRKHQTFNGVSKTSKPQSTHQRATQLADGLNLVEGVSFTVAPYGCEFCEQRFATARSRKEHQAKCTAKKEEPRVVSDTSVSDRNSNTRDELVSNDQLNGGVL